VQNDSLEKLAIV